MEPISSIDSLTIQIINISQYKNIINKFLQDHGYIIKEMKSNNPDIKTYRVFHIKNPRVTICYVNHTGIRHNATTYTTYKFIGLKSYHTKKDRIKNKGLLVFIDCITKLDVEYRITKLDIAFDFFIENKSIENFLPIIKGAKTSVNNPFNTFKTTLYAGDINVEKPSVKAYVYHKSIKESLNNNIIRFEVSIRNFNDKENSLESVLEHTQKVLSQYRLFYFDNKANCNKVKREYRDNIPKKNKENFSRSLEKKAVRLSAIEIDLSLSNGIQEYIQMIFKKIDKPLRPIRELPEWFKKIPPKQDLVRKKVNIQNTVLNVLYIFYAFIYKEKLIKKYISPNKFYIPRQ